MTLLPDPTKKTALVTGANGGLGSPVTLALLDAGFAVVGLARKIQQSDFSHPNFTALPASLDSFDAARKAVETILSRSGKIDVLAHLVGGFAGGQTVAETDDATFQRMFDINVNSALHILRAVIPPMRKARAGRIIVIPGRKWEPIVPRRPPSSR
jgi:NAD(P)-dependent dehydrogenase (short-subunit alcohol dehydrogenase family)